METTTRRPQFSGPSTISPGNPATGPTGTLHTDDLESGVLRGAGEPTERVAAGGIASATFTPGAERMPTPATLAASHWLEASRDNVRRWPLTWLGIAVAAGALIARLVR